MPNNEKNMETTHRFKFSEFIDVLDKLKENGCLHTELEAHLVDTPFWELIKACSDGRVSRLEHHASHQIINRFLACYDSSSEKFSIGGTKRRITDSDISHILSLPNEGEKVEQIRKKNKKSTGSRLVQRYFESVSRVTSTEVKKSIKTAKDHKRWEDVAALVIAQLMILVSFLNTSKSLTWRLLEYCEDIPRLREYNWANAVNERLKKALKETNASRGGCPLLVLFWFCENSTIVSPTKEKESHTPSFIKWDLRRIDDEVLKCIERDRMTGLVKEESDEDLEESSNPSDSGEKEEELAETSTSLYREEEAIIHEEDASGMNPNEAYATLEEDALDASRAAKRKSSPSFSERHILKTGLQSFNNQPEESNDELVTQIQQKDLEVKSLKEQLSKLREENAKLLHGVQKLPTLEEVEKLKLEMSSMEATMLDDKVKNIDEKAKLRMRLLGTKRKLDALYIRYKQNM